MQGKSYYYWNSDVYVSLKLLQSYEGNLSLCQCRQVSEAGFNTLRPQYINVGFLLTHTP